MEQDERAVVDPSEGSTEQRGEAAAGAEEDGEQERVPGAENSIHGGASESAKEQDLEQGPWPEPSLAAAASGVVETEERETFEFRATAATATPPSTSSRVRSKGGKQAVPIKFAIARGDEGGRSEAPDLVASSSAAQATDRHDDVSVVADGEQGTAPGDAENLKRVCSAPGSTVAIAHASPPDSYRRMPWRSRKQYYPKRFVAAAGASPLAAAPAAGDPPPPASLGSALPSTSASGLRTASSGVIDASASSSSSNRPPSRGRKQPRPEHFIPEEAEASASAKARRSDIVLDRFLTSVVHGSAASDSEWVRNVTAADSAVRGGRQRGGECFRIRDASRHAARGLHAALRLSRLGASCGGPCSSTSASAPGSTPGEPDGRGRFYGVLAVLGASLALSMVSCVLFYIVGQRNDSVPSGEKPDK